MNVVERNKLFLQGNLAVEGIFPHLEEVHIQDLFPWDFGLSELPEEAGIIVIRGPRQFGKSTWLESQLKQTIEKFGPGSAFFLNGDYISDADALEQEILALLSLFQPTQRIRRIFIDEITAIEQWQKAVKRLADAGELRRVLLVTTGSKARDLQREGELLPGRKGKLARSTYIFIPLSYAIFRAKAFSKIGELSLPAYLISGGSPAACSALLKTGAIPEYIFQTTSEWVYGECALAERSRASLLRLIDQLMRRVTSPVAQTTLAEESGMANNTVAQGYLDLLSDLLILGVTEPYDPMRKIRLPRKASKYPFVNLLAANTWSPYRFTTASSFVSSSPEIRGAWYEWAVAAELFRRTAKAGNDLPLHTFFWRSDKHEIDYIRNTKPWIEVKLGKVSPFEFDWFRRTFPNKKLIIVGSSSFESNVIQAVTLEEFLLHEDL